MPVKYLAKFFILIIVCPFVLWLPVLILKEIFATILDKDNRVEEF
jgi:hypothetical protein